MRFFKKFFGPSLLLTNQKVIDEEFCCFCCDKILDSLVASCGHQFCGKCFLEYWYRNQKKIVSCPFCSETILNVRPPEGPKVSKQHKLSKESEQYNRRFCPQRGWYWKCYYSSKDVSRRIEERYVYATFLLMILVIWFSCFFCPRLHKFLIYYQLPIVYSVIIFVVYLMICDHKEKRRNEIRNQR
jgi:hypothetical protein